MPEVQLLSKLEELRESGRCDLNGVGETAVGSVVAPSPPCVDEMGTNRCTAMMTSGMFECGVDFCSTCSLGGQCDLSCGVCNASAADSSGHRRVQDDANCEPQYFIAASDNVTRDCCDGPGGCDVGGVPTTCDAKCATRFVGFFDRCEHVLQAFNPAAMQAYHLLCVTFCYLPSTTSLFKEE